MRAQVTSGNRRVARQASHLHGIQFERGFHGWQANGSAQPQFSAGGWDAKLKGRAGGSRRVDESVFKSSFFERDGETPDEIFYREPRLLKHIDEQAIEAVRRLYAEVLPKNAALPDLTSSYRSHLPTGAGMDSIGGSWYE
jgi:hypothetical protein